MGAQYNSDVFEKLQAEFSPPLDTSLIAAMVADYVTDDKECSVQELQQLRAMLSELAAQAEKDETSLASQITHDLYISPTDDTTSNDGHDIFSANEGASIPCTATTSRCSGSDNSLQPFDSPLGFLQTAFPHLPTSRLRSALGSSEDADEIDMEAVVESIMATEFVKELEERGLEDEVEPPVQPWETVRKRPKKKVKGKTITLGDIRQQQHTRSSFASQSPRVDPWTQFSSVASHLSDLLPSHPPSYFLSLFHSPEYPSPADALRSGLASMKSPSQLSPECETRLAVNLFAMLTSDETLSELPDVDNERMRDDVNLAVRATLAARPGSEDAADVALDLIDLLRWLESDMLDWTVYHSPVPPSPSTFPSGGDPREVDARRTLPTGPPSPPRVPIRRATTESPRSGGSSSSSSTAQAWQTIPVISRGPLVNPHAEFIPAYNPSAKIGKGRHPRKASTLKNERKLDVLDPQWHRHKRRAGELMEASKEALMEASRAWQRGSAKTRGGEVALTYAERARKLQEQARRENLDAAWDMVQAKRISTDNGSSIDLHGTTADEAIHIVEVLLEENPPSSLKPLKIITGRGTHSINRVGVLGPAVQAALTNAGWHVAKWDGGLVVRGRSFR